MLIPKRKLNNEYDAVAGIAWLRCVEEFAERQFDGRSDAVPHIYVCANLVREVRTREKEILAEARKRFGLSADEIRRRAVEERTKVIEFRKVP